MLAFSPDKILRQGAKSFFVNFPRIGYGMGVLLQKLGAEKTRRKILPEPKDYPRPTTIDCRRNGFQWQLDLSQWLDWHLFFGFQSQEDRQLLSLVRSGDCVIDGGGYIGILALRLAARVGSTGQIHCFEADPLNFARLEQHVRLNSLQNVHCLPMALAERSGHLEMVRPWPENGGGNLIDNGAWVSSIARIRVPSLSLDDWCQRESVQRVNLLKLDLEGYEVRALRGARQLLSRFRPVLFLEAHEPNLQNHGDDLAGLERELASLNYRWEKIPGDIASMVAFPR